MQSVTNLLEDDSMIFIWTRQFLVATGIFAMFMAGQTLNVIAKEKRMANEALEKASRTVRLNDTNQSHLN